MAKKKTTISIEERLQQALVPKEEQPYEVPGNWVWSYTDNMVNIFRGVSYNKNEAHTVPKISDCLILRGGNITEGDLVLDTDDNVYVDSSIVNSEQYIRKYDVIIVSSTGSTKVIGRAGISKATYDKVAFGAFLTLVRPRNWINKRYLDLFFLSDLYRNRIQKLASGVNINNIRIGYILESPIPLPPLPEQQRIVSHIENLFPKLDEAKEKLQEVIDGFETRKAAILHKAFTGELTKKWREEHGVGMDSWEDSLLKDVCDVNPKKVDTKNLSDQLSVSFIPMAAVSDVNGCITEPLVKTLGEVKKGFTNFCEGDVILAKITPCMENGKSAVVGKLVNDIGFGSTEFYVLRTSVKLYNNYLYHIVRSSSFRDLAKGEMTGAVGQQRVPKSFIENFTIKLPRLDEQQEIVRIVDSLLYKEQKAKEAAKSVLEQIDLMKKSILARAFRGELGTNDPNEPSSIELLRQAIANNQNI